MKAQIKQMAAWLARNQKGFTLIEMLVVVGIVLTLTAVIVPSVVKFSQKGEDGAKAAELESVQTAMYSMMAAKGMTAITATASGSTVQDWSAEPSTTDAAADALAGYLKKDSTTYCYNWTATGSIAQVDCP